MNVNIAFHHIQLQQSSANIPCILVVEDNEDNLVLITQIINLLNCKFITTRDGMNVSSLAKTYQPDLILLDIILPDVNGLELVAELKQDRRTNQIPIVAVTGLALAEDRDRILKAGCDDYISKPYLIDDLEAIIERFIQRSFCCNRALNLQLENFSAEVQK